MALVKLGPIVQTIIGSLGGITFRQSGAMTIATPRRRRTSNKSPAQVEAKRTLAHHVSIWTTGSASRRLGWENFARSQTWVNTLGLGRHPTGRQCFLYYAGIVDPRGIYALGLWNPILGGESLVPKIVSLSFSATGACNVITSNFSGLPLFEQGFLTYPLQYGNRRSGGIRKILGIQIRSSNTLNWRTAINTEGLTLTAGDVVEVKFYWRQDSKAYGQAAIAQTTITA